MAGQSQGGGHAALLGIKHPVARVICFGAPKDFSLALTAPAAWLRLDSATPKSAFFAFNHDQDRQGCSPAQQAENPPRARPAPLRSTNRRRSDETALRSLAYPHHQLSRRKGDFTRSAHDRNQSAKRGSLSRGLDLFAHGKKRGDRTHLEKVLLEILAAVRNGVDPLMKCLIIAEKPSVAADLARALGKNPQERRPLRKRRIRHFVGRRSLGGTANAGGHR